MNDAPHQVSLDDILPVLRLSLGREDFSVQDWAVSSLHYTVRNAISAGLYRIGGGVEIGEERLAWALILKVVQPQDDNASNDPEHWNYWRREALAYQSRLLEDLTRGNDPDQAGLAVPRCYQVEEKPDGRLWLWLEDVAEADGGRWTLERYGLAQRGVLTEFVLDLAQEARKLIRQGAV